MEGFFSKAQTKSTTRPDGKQLSCFSCGLYKSAESPKMQGTGGFKKRIMCIGNLPTESDDWSKSHWNSRAGSFLRKSLAMIDIDLEEDCYSIYALNCYTPEFNEKTPVKKLAFHINCCRRIVLNEIKMKEPHVILLFGAAAVNSVIGNVWKKDIGKLEKWLGWTIPDQWHNAWIMPMLSPEHVLNLDKKEIYTYWDNQFDMISKLLEMPVPTYKEPKIHYLFENDSLEVFRSLKTDIVAIDYETTGLKPEAPNHKIVVASMAVSENEVYTFIVPENKNKCQPFIDILENKKIKKIGHNIKYENRWTKIRLFKTKIMNWVWDTMLASHLLDNRQNITGLKFQTYVNFGVGDYSSEIEPILQGSDTDNSNSYNQVESFVKSKENAIKMMKYCALDSIFTFRLYLKQQLQINK